MSKPTLVFLHHSVTADALKIALKYTGFELILTDFGTAIIREEMRSIREEQHPCALLRRQAT